MPRSSSNEIAKETAANAAAVAAQAASRAASVARDVAARATEVAASVAAIASKSAENVALLGNDIAATRTRVEDQCERLDRVEKKVDHIDECMDEMKLSLAFFKGRVAAVSSVIGASLTLIIERLL